MSKTKYQIKGRDFYINDAITYSEIPNGNEKARGLLFNARFIQGVFQDVNPANATRYNRFGRVFDPERNTDELIAALPEWYAYGLRAFTVGLMGGGPCMSLSDWGSLEFGGFSKDGRSIDAGVMRRLERLIRAADELGMLVIVSYFYWGQFRYYDDEAIERACRTATEALAKLGYDNIIIEVANEYDIFERMGAASKVCTPENMARLIGKCREWSKGRFAVGCSTYMLGDKDRPVMEASDVCLFHGNDTRRQKLHENAMMLRSWCPDKPMVVNEDSAMISQLDVAFEDHFSWGYYNNLTKQEPPCDWRVTPGEDTCFARRVAECVGIMAPDETDNDIALLGFEPHIAMPNGGRFVRLSTMHPERIDRVRYYEDDTLLDVAFSEPFYYLPMGTWRQAAYVPSRGAKEFTAEIVMCDGSVRYKKQNLTTLVD